MNIINGACRPTDTTEGAVGDIYTNTTTGEKYRCIAVYEIKSDTVTYYYTWVRINTSSTTTTDNGRYVDETTGVAYELKVNNGKLTMEEV